MTIISKLKRLCKPPLKISFQQGFDLTDLPICTFRQGNSKLNFLLDTGANKNIIDKKVVPYIEHEDCKEHSTLYGMEGNVVNTGVCKITLSFKDNSYEDQFLVHDMSAAFDRIKQESGVRVHGLLGSGFFQKYQYVLDFNELVAYSKI